LQPSTGQAGVASRLARKLRLVRDHITGKAIARRFTRIEQLIGGASATYIGNNRLLTVVRVSGHRLMLYLDAEDRLLTPWVVTTGSYDTVLSDYIVNTVNPTDHCIDVGTNFGYFTCLLATLCTSGRVVGIEVEERCVDLARDNVLINSLFDRATVIHAAASDSDKELTFYRRSHRSGNTSLCVFDEAFTEFMRERPVEPFSIRGVRIDDVAAGLGGRVDFMKIDVEGAEPLVLAGARATIAANPQLRIAMEWSPGQIQHAGFDVPQFVASFAGMGLIAHDFDGAKLVPLTADALAALPYRGSIVLQRGT